MSRIVSALFGRASAGVTATGVAGRIARANIGIMESVTSTATGPILSGFANVITSEVTYAAHRAVTNQVPEASHAIRAFWAGQLSLDDTTRILANNNISFQNRRDPNGNFWTFAWDSIIKLEQPKLSEGTIIEKWRTHQLSTDEAFIYLGLHGITRNGDRDRLLSDRGQFDFGTATSLWRQGQIAFGEYMALAVKAGIGDDRARDLLLTQTSVAPLGDYRDWWLAGWIDDVTYASRLRREEVSTPADIVNELRMRTPISPDQTRTDYWLGMAPLPETRRRMELLGYGTDDERRVVLESESAYAPGDALRLFWRGAIGNVEMRAQLSDYGFVTPERQDHWIVGQRPLPQVGELVTWGSRDLWNAATVNALGLDDEFPPALSWFMQRQGWDTLEAVPNQGAGGAPATDPWDLAWRSHWRLPSLQQVIQAARVIRPDTLAQLRQLVPGVTVPTNASIDAVAKAEGYPPVVRAWLNVLAFKRLRPSQAVRLYTLEKRGRPWLVRQLLDYGYTPQAAEDYADMVDAQVEYKGKAWERKSEEETRALTLKEIIRGYELGVTTTENAVGQLEAVGMDEERAQSYLAAVIARAAHTILETGLKTLRKSYLEGEFSPAELQPRLIALGVLPDQRARYVTLWTLQRTQSRRMLATGKIQQYVATGHITWQDGQQRLLNLGWSNPDTLLLVQEARHKADELNAKAKAADELAKGKRQRELERLNKQHEAQIKTNQKALERLTPPAMLKRLVCEAVVSPGWAGQRLAAMGYDDDTVTLYIEDWASQNARNKKCLPVKTDDTGAPPAQPAPVAEPPSTGKMTVQPTAATVLPVGKQGP